MLLTDLLSLTPNFATAAQAAESSTIVPAKIDF